jgi:rhodanese-related sulfurtransferase
MSASTTRREMPRVDPVTLKEWLHDGGEIALFDVREHGQYGESHLFYGICVPYSRLEPEALRLAPRKSVRVVVYDEDGDSVAPRAAQRLAALGYSDVHVLQGGTRAWKAAGLALFAGVNLPSKTFGELVEETYRTPRVSATELAAMLERKDDVIVLDGRPLPEFRKMSIPTATCCPNGELALRVRKLVPDERTRIVINCAGRTRSIIGAQTLINLGLRNPVFALQNGTQGWFLADLPLEHGNTRHYGGPAGTGEMREAALALAERFDVAVVGVDTVRSWAADGDRSLFLCDIRTPEEFAAGTLPGARHAPGGQLLQACDQFVGVRHARIVLFDSDGIRALTVASWLRQMGHEACVLEGGLASGLALRGIEETFSAPSLGVDATTLARQLAAGEVVAIDVRPSMQFRQSHIPGSRWSIRPRLAAAVGGERRPVVLIADEPAAAVCAALELQSLGTMHRVLSGGLAAWREAGLPLEASEHMPPDEECIDFLFFVHDRHDGNKEAARQYLAWETGLVAQLDARERASFRLGAATR